MNMSLTIRDHNLYITTPEKLLTTSEKVILLN